MIRRLNKARHGGEECADVAALAAADNGRMHGSEERRRGETSRSSAVMAHTAIVPRWYVVYFLAHRNCAVMTGGAVVSHARVVIDRSRKSVCAQMTD